MNLALLLSGENPFALAVVSVVYIRIRAPAAVHSFLESTAGAATRLFLFVLLLVFLLSIVLRAQLHRPQFKRASTLNLFVACKRGVSSRCPHQHARLGHLVLVLGVRARGVDHARLRRLRESNVRR